MHSQEGWAQVATQYAERGLGGKLKHGIRPAVVVVDLINGFTDKAFPAGSNLDDVVKATTALLAAARDAHAPVVFTTIAFSNAMVADNIWLKKMPAMSGLIEGTRWVAVDERLDRRDDEAVIVKRAASSFTGTDLNSFLTAKGIDSVIICGATTSGCVRATAVDACMLGWPAFVVRDCVGDRAVEPHEASLFDIDAKYGDVLSLSQALEMLAGAAIRFSR
ncbi:Nicotinamidase-related amidase OS=Eoetvoesiella caeni OX=645616 GN=DFR37_11751 PE=4 SV=1 [Eoetvoesiella caeni]